ncbi:17128_t:CDS:1 [Funneliformis geosporum]|uniref:2024_t:CDS:1 n=1 Tax=Funneliformis geosporum TaxID=1117311 RepID=A0A9W4WN99_9GLOM|nr:17128_t:CDS:1 [Funneliformis geosporum]CAI2166517.1 2024_t:CDS:1 [Funneliformis geosporum]
MSIIPEIAIKPRFPPTLTTQVLLEKLRENNKPNSITPNAFIVYRMELIEENLRNNIKLHMCTASTFASKYWGKESIATKEFYQKLADDAKALYKPISYKFIMDKHTEIKNNQGNGKVLPSRATGDADSGYLDQTDQTGTPLSSTIGLPIEDPSASPQFYEDPGTSSADKELFRMLDS